MYKLTNKKYLLIGGGILLYILLKEKLKSLNPFKDAEASSEIKEAVQTTKSTQIAIENDLGLTKTQQDFVQKKATEIKNAFHTGLWGMTEDEPAIINAINSLQTENQAKYLAMYYQSAFGENLGKQLTKYLNTSELNEINTRFLSQLY